MKTLSTIFLLLLAVASFGIILPTSERPLSEHLLEVNAEWSKHLTDNPRFCIPVQFDSETARIQRHLFEVCDLIDRNTESNFSGELAGRRSSMTSQLRNYAKAGEFPINTYSSDRHPYFIDERGTACAVGYLMLNNGFEAEALEVHSKINNAYLREIPSDWLSEWVNYSGLSVDELALIQPGYPPNTVWDNLGGSIEGTVYAILPYEDELILGGDFSVNGVNYNIASFDGTSIVHWPGTLTGAVRDLVEFDGKIYACGAFEGLQRDIAVWENNTWNYSNAVMGKTSEAYDLYVKDDQLYCATSYSGFAGYDYIITRLNGEEWEQLAVFDERVDCLYSFNDELVAAGEFQTLFSSDGMVPMNYVAIMNENLEWREAGTGLNAPVYALSEFENYLVASGQLFDAENSAANFGRLLDNGIWSEPVNPGATPIEEEVYSIQDMLLYDGSYYFVGNFYLATFGSFGSDVTEVNFVDDGMGSYYPGASPMLAASAGTIYTCAVWNGSLYIAGDFDGGFLGPRKFARTDLVNSILEQERLSLDVYPNPTADELNIRLPEGWKAADYILINLQGKRVQQGRLNGNGVQMLDLSAFPSGVYTLELLETAAGPKASTRVILK